MSTALVSVSQLAASASQPSSPPQSAGAGPSAKPSLVSVSDIARNGIPEPTEEEQFRGDNPEYDQFLKNNSGYQYMPADSKFPNRPPGVYPTVPGNEWRSNPQNQDTQQAPVDLHLLQHSLEGAASGAAAVAPALTPSIIAAGTTALLPAATRGVVAIGTWAEQHPFLARAVLEGIKGATWYKVLKGATKD